MEHWNKRNPERLRETNKRWREENPERLKEINKSWRERNADKLREKNRTFFKKHTREKRTFWTEKAYDEAFQKQKGCCFVCGKKCKALNADHDHETNKPRALLCPRCNSLVDQPEYLQALLSYPEMFR